MRAEFRAQNIGEGTSVYGVMGHPIGHSMSPAIHNAAYAATGVDAVYLPFDVDSDAAGFVRRAFDLGVRGLSVTIPHKTDVIPALDEVEPEAKRIGAVNTILSREGRLVGTNTDLWGALSAIAGAAGSEAALGGKRALVLGAGGAARAVASGLAGAGASVSVTDVIRDRAEALAAELGATALAPDEADPAAFDIVANATPVGMHPAVDACPLDPERLRAGQIVFDAVYNPRETLLLREARSRGCLAVEGIEMFIRQGARQFELWTGRTAPADTMRDVLLARLGR
jgi:shikimate dehydrogenase